MPAFDSDLHEPRTNAEQSETGVGVRVIHESRPALTRSELLRSIDGRWLHRLPLPWGDVWWFDRHWNAIPDPATEGPICYFIGAADGPIKIGFTRTLSNRLRVLQQHSPWTLAVLATCKGGQLQERAYHKRFSAFRLHGEWFECCPEIEAEIARLNAPNGDNRGANA